MNNGTFKDSKKTNHHHHSSIVTIMTTITRLARCAFVILSSTAGLVHSFAGVVHPQSRSSSFALFSSTADVATTPTELPDSLVDAAEIAANSCASFAEASGALGRCRVVFDTSAGDETYTILKSSSEFMQNFVKFMSYRMIPGMQEERQTEMMKVATARAALQANAKDPDAAPMDETKKAEWMHIIETGGRDDPDYQWKGPVVRVYFPDEGSAALARRDWMGHPSEDKVPPCVQFSSCGGVQMTDISKDWLVFFFCPKAAESEYVEALLQKTETEATGLKLSIFVNPNLVDMGVTGFGMVGRRLRERLLDGLTDIYYLRTLPWGALTRMWPNSYTVWQEEETAEGGYKLIRTLPFLPSNPEVEDIYDIENGTMEERKGGGPLDALGDFVNGMMKL